MGWEVTQELDCMGWVLLSVLANLSPCVSGSYLGMGGRLPQTSFGKSFIIFYSMIVFMLVYMGGAGVGPFFFFFFCRDEI